MKLDTLIKLILIFPKNVSEAKTSEDIVTSYFKSSDRASEDRPTHNTFIRRQIDDMEELGMIDFLPAVKKPSERVKRSERYFMKETSLLQYFMNSKVALNVIWASNVMQSLGPVFGLKEVKATARGARMNQREKVLAEKIRMVPDGIERKYAKIEANVLTSCVAAIERNHTLKFTHHDRQGKVYDEIKEGIERTVLGLVAKDGTIYAITCRGFEDVPFHIPMHRIKAVEDTGTRAYARTEFDIDDHISGQHQLAHILADQESPIEMVLKVAPESMFHFRERAISSVLGEQIEEPPQGDDKRYTIKITVPFTVQLAPFLWSHAGWVEVVSPPALRKYVGERLLAAASYYKKDVKPRFN